MEDIKQQVGQMIKDARKNKGLTQKELGRAMGVSESAINKLEKSHSVPSLPTLQKLATALNLKLKISLE